MKHFAQVENGIVLQVIVAEQDFIDTLPNPQSWIETTNRTKGGIHYDQYGKPDGGVVLRANYAGIGHTYDSTNDVFYAPQPFASWTISAPTWLWQAPIPYPNNGKPYYWDESTTSWIEVIEQ